MIDLHIHTIATPHHASWEPEQLAAAAAARGLTVIAAADHNTTASVLALAAAGARHGVRVVSGVEIDSAFGGKLWHTLVYGADPAAPAMLALCAAVFERNVADARRLIADLPGRGFTLAGLGEQGRSPNVADVATALAHLNRLPGRVPGEGDEEAGMRYLLTELRGAYRPVGVDEVIAVAHGLGAVAVLAHPGRSKGIYAVPAADEDLEAMVEAGLDGVEVYYPAHSAEQVALYAALAAKYGLLVSGGSDSHHPGQALASVDPQLVTVLGRL
ncbi:MAG: PHP domain-containing protein [Chloroflexales bacterium]|nr:PHP domain-containing protein [Chloroflexales bacterium]